MTHYTVIDSVGLRVEFSSASAQRTRLNEMLTRARSIPTFYVNALEQSYGIGGMRIEYQIYSHNTMMATINTGVFQYGTNRENSTYYMKIVFAGLKSYDDIIDNLRNKFLLDTCSWLNTKRLPFRLVELDCDIDIHCNYDNFYAMQIKKVPNVKMESEQVFTTTHYLQKKTKSKRSTSALFYDKGAKAVLGDEDSITRFELKLSSNFFKNRTTMEAIGSGLISVFDRYAIFHFEDLNFKNQVIGVHNYIEFSNIPNKAREYNKLMPQLHPFRHFPDLGFIMSFINRLFTIKSYKMVLREDEIEMARGMAPVGSASLDNDWFLN